MINLTSIKDLTFEIIDRGKFYGLAPSKRMTIETREELLVRIQKTNQFIFTVLIDADKQVRNLKSELLGARVGFTILATAYVIDKLLI